MTQEKWGPGGEEGAAPTQLPLCHCAVGKWLYSGQLQSKDLWGEARGDRAGGLVTHGAI